MKAIEFFKQKELKQLVNSNHKWFEKYQGAIVSLYDNIEELINLIGNKKLNSQIERILKTLRAIKLSLNYILTQHHNADMYFFELSDQLGRPETENLFAEPILYGNIRSKEFKEQIRSTKSEKIIISLHEDVLTELEHIKKSLEKPLRIEKKYIGNYLSDFNTYMISAYYPFHSIEGAVEELEKKI